MVIFDSSAILAILFEEQGQDAASAQLDRGAISTVNMVEVLTRLIDRGWSREDARSAFDALKLKTIALEVDIAHAAANMRQVTKALGLSLGDRVCLATAIVHNLSVYTSDRAWADLDIGVDIRLIR